MLAELVEKLKAIEDRLVASELLCAGPGDVECDFCTERKLKAVKSCLVCVDSVRLILYPHYHFEAF